ncbi:MAG: sigma-70 family RNA polymerase sigma factor [Candidatus Gastranaerophilales bacterium]|nr:sigma-70 family RNA polymerase sigma factor [Candidatus Gastranaerophilales bacterium]
METDVKTLTPEEMEIISQAYQKYYAKIYAYVYYSTGKDKNFTEDVVSDIFALACEKIKEFAPHENQGGWLHLAARNKIRELRRRLAGRELYCEDIEETGQYVADSDYGRLEIETIIQRALTPEERSRFLRYFVWGYELQEVADLEGVSKANMSVRLSRLREKLKRELRLGL